MLYDKYQVYCIILALSQFGWNTLPAKEILLDSIAWLHENYKRTKDRTFLIKAVNHAYALLQLGYDYKQGKDIFEELVDALGLSVEEVFPARQWIYRKRALTKSGIRSVIGRWNSNLQSMKINDVVQDIYDNIRNHHVGEYLYYSGRVMFADGEKTLWENTYRLYVTEDENVLYDVNRNQYYTFEEVSTHDKYCHGR